MAMQMFRVRRSSGSRRVQLGASMQCPGRWKWNSTQAHLCFPECQGAGFSSCFSDALLTACGYHSVSKPSEKLTWTETVVG